MYEKCNPSHPDKIADRIAGAIVDLAYLKNSHYLTLGPALADIYNNPKIAVEVLIGHHECYIIVESSITFNYEEIRKIVDRIVKDEVAIELIQVPQDKHLADNQAKGLKCGDNGIFKGVAVSDEENILCEMAKNMYNEFKSDGKYIIDNKKIVICQSNARKDQIKDIVSQYVTKNDELIINPLGEWTGGIDVDTGATNRKLGSDMGRGVTGGGLHGKDLSKADVSINIYLHVLAQDRKSTLTASCAIGDKRVTIKQKNRGEIIEIVPYDEIVKVARSYIQVVGGFEKLAEWGLIR